MSPRAAAALAAASLLVLPLDAVAATIHVPGDQPTIQAGIDVATGDDSPVAPESDSTPALTRTWSRATRLGGKP